MTDGRSGFGGWTTDATDPAHTIDMLASGSCPPDTMFDRFLEEPLRRLSPQHWTPLAVVARAADWLDGFNVRTVVDIGSGAGKFCVAAALASRCHFTGFEHRASLVASARALARTFGVGDRTYFIHGALGQVPLPTADAYYLYNPFEENVMDPTERIDDAVVLDRQRMLRDLGLLQALLSRAAAGTYVLVYNGFGGSLPASYQRVRVDRGLPHELSLWRKATSRIAVGSRRVGGPADAPSAA